MRKIKFDKCIIGTGKSGIDFSSKLAKEYDLPTEAKSVQLVVRFEAPQKYFQKLIDISYDFKLYQKFDNVSLRSFCTNNNAAYVAVEETYGNISYNSTNLNGSNVTLYSDYGASVLQTIQSNGSGSFNFTGLSNATYYVLGATLRNSSVMYATSSYVFINASVNYKNLDFYSSGTTSTTTIYPACFAFSSGCSATTSQTTNGCYIVGRS